jgi:predicted ATPase/DNA-binding XRE family transcriptional regulator
MLQTLPLADLLRQFRAEAHLSQEELAERAGISARAIGDIETGVSLWPRAITIALLAEALELDSQSRDALRRAASRRGLRRGEAAAALPAAVALVGRENETAALRALLLDPATRLVTLTGGPGVGKTALAVTTATELAGGFERVLFIEFATLPDPVLVPTKIGLALGVRDVGGQSVTASLASAIGDRSVLLVLDNFERMTAAAPIVAELLAATRHLKLLVTSRLPLHLSMERVVKIAPLPPDSSLRLLNDRIASDAQEALVLQDDAAIVELTRALGGVPLAINLAAPLLRTASARELATRLKDPLDVLAAMNDAIGWSYELLGEKEQRLLRTLAVFAGAFTEEGAQRIAPDKEDINALETLQALAALIDHSLVNVAEYGTSDVEFGLHPLVSEFAAKALDGDGESEAAHLRFVDYCTALAHVQPRAEPFADLAIRARINRESSHFDGALGWLKSTGRLDRALSLAFKFWPIWYRRGANAHGYTWLRSLLAAADKSAVPIDEGLRADANWAASGLALASGQFDAAERHVALALSHKRAIGDQKAVASLLAGAGVCASFKGNYAAGRISFEESLAIRRELGDGLDVARSLSDLGVHASDEGHQDEANGHLEEALTLYRAAGRRMGVSLSLGSLALVAVRAGFPRRAEPLAREAARLAEEIGYAESARAANLALSLALMDSADLAEAESVGLGVAAGDESASGELCSDILRALAAIEFRLERPDLAARLLGAAAATPPLPVIPLVDRPAHAALVESVARILGENFETEWTGGRAESARALLAACQFRE